MVSIQVKPQRAARSPALKREFIGANGEGRTPMAFRPPDPKSMRGGSEQWRTLANQAIAGLELGMRGGCWRHICFGFATDARARFSPLIRPIHPTLVPNRSVFAPSVRSANTDENHPNPEPLQDRFYTLRFESQQIRNRNDDLVVARPRSRAERGVGDRAFVGGHVFHRIPRT